LLVGPSADSPRAMLACVLEGLTGSRGEACARMWRRVADRYLQLDQRSVGLVSDMRALCMTG